MGRFFLILIVLSSNISYAISQDASGIIQNIDGESIPFSEVTVLNTNKGAIADEEGKYVITDISDGEYEFHIIAFSYSDKIETVTVTNGKVPTITLELEAEIVDEVVISAQKVEQNIIDVPISVTSLDAQQIKDSRTWEQKDLNGLIPNYFYTDAGVSFQNIQSIRGIQVFANDPAVATYVDGVNSIDALSGGIQLFDVDKIEVLRGPQGTLFGRNTMGGVVNITTKKPTNATTGTIEASLGNYDLQRIGFGFRTPLKKDKLFFGFSGQYYKKGGFLENDTTGITNPDEGVHGEEVGSEVSGYGNMFLRWYPKSDLEFSLNVKGQLDNSIASGAFARVHDPQLARDNPDKIYLSTIGTHSRRLLNASLNIKKRFSAFDLLSVTTFQNVGFGFTNLEFIPPTNGTSNIFHSHNNGEIGKNTPSQDVFTQELKIQSNNPNQRIRYTGGLYAFNQEVFEAFGNNSLELGNDIYAIFRNQAENNGFAVFGQGEIDIIDKLTFTGGLRYDYEQRDATFNGQNENYPSIQPVPGVVIDSVPFDLVSFGGNEIQTRADTTLNTTFDAFTYKAALSYKLTEKSALYGSYSKGYRVGGINYRRFFGEDLTFEPEFSDNFEIGYKANLFDQKVYLAATLYWIDWQDIQFFKRIDDVNTFTDNFGDAFSRGLELEVRSKPMKNLAVDLIFGYNDSEYKDFAEEEVNAKIDGNRLANSPEYTSTLAAQYSIPLEKDWSLVLRGEWRGTGKYYTDFQNVVEQKPYNIFNSRAGFTSKKYDLFVWVRNLTNERYISFGVQDSSAPFNSVIMSPPTTFGATASVKF